MTTITTDTTREQPRPAQEERAAWETPTLRFVGTIAELVQVTKKSGTQDCSGRKRISFGGCG
jgi:hypothetical protein